MTPEEAARVAWVYHPSAEEQPHDEPINHDRNERRLAVVFAMLAALAVGFGIGLGLS